MPAATNDGRVYSATYSNTPVFEFNCDGINVMRRRADDWINATHILKVAGLDKPARTRVLEREVQKGVHEKVQGGYGKYQGTWIPLSDGRTLADRNSVLGKMLPIFDFVPGDRSPPPAPKHVTAPAQKPRAPRQQGAGAMRRAAAERHISEDHYESTSLMQGGETPDNVSMVSESMVEDDMLPPSQFSTGHRKRKRDWISLEDQQHQLWADSLLDYFMLLESDDRFPQPPDPPPTVNLNRPIDEKGHTALHWAAAMGDLDVVRDLIRRGADVSSLSINRETPLMRAVMFTNNFDKNTMLKMARTLISTVSLTDWFGSTVFHHIAATTSSKNKYFSARYYLDSIISVLTERWAPDDITRILNQQDNNGDTAVMIAARYGARKCVRSLLGRNVTVDIPNQLGETADALILQLNRRRQARGQRQTSSSPFAPDAHLNGAVASLSRPAAAHYRSQTANTLMSTIAPSIAEQCEQLAAAFEAELDDKEQDSVETERVLRMRQAEIESIQRQIAELEAVDRNGLDDNEAQLDSELYTLVAESEALLELEQRHELQQLLEREHAKAKQSSAHATANGGDAMQEKLKLATALRQAQSERKALVPEIVQALSVAGGIGERQGEYKRLITGALGIKEADVETMLPDILAELLEARQREVLDAS